MAACHGLSLIQTIDKSRPASIGSGSSRSVFGATSLESTIVDDVDFIPIHSNKNDDDNAIVTYIYILDYV